MQTYLSREHSPLTGAVLLAVGMHRQEVSEYTAIQNGGRVPQSRIVALRVETRANGMEKTHICNPKPSTW